MAHFFLLTFPTQGHINPTLLLAHRLLSAGSTVTFANSAFVHRHISNNFAAPDNLFFVSFSEGFDEPFIKATNEFISQLEQAGRCNLPELLRFAAAAGRPVSCIIYNQLLPWAADVAFEAGVPSVAFWPQPASVFAIYHCYFNGYKTAIDKSFSGDDGDGDGDGHVELPGLPILASQDLPSFLSPSNPIRYAIPTMRHLFDSIQKQASHAVVLINTFDALEPDALSSIDSVRMIGAGPLIASNNTSGFDLFEKSDDYVRWLDSKPKSSAVYVSFGSISALEEKQIEEISKGLAASGRPFLWVLRVADGVSIDGGGVVKKAEQGLLVPWCGQVEVLSHPAVGCFVTHCGWNSTIECLASGVPAVVFPHWADQPTNAKFVEDVWKTGIRAKMNEEGILKGEELKRCLDVVMESERAEEMRKNAEKWKRLAREAAAPGGSSVKNIKDFVESFIFKVG